MENLILGPAPNHNKIQARGSLPRRPPPPNKPFLDLFGSLLCYFQKASLGKQYISSNPLGVHVASSASKSETNFGLEAHFTSIGKIILPVF